MSEAAPNLPSAPKGIMPVLFLGVLMGALDIAIVGPALPDIQKMSPPPSVGDAP